MWRQLVAKFPTNASGATWWSNFLLMQVAPPGGQISYQCKWCHLVAKFSTNTSGATWRSNFQLSNCCHPVNQFVRNRSGATFGKNCKLYGNSSYYVKPWVRCVSGSVCKCHSGRFLNSSTLFRKSLIWRIWSSTSRNSARRQVSMGGFSWLRMDWHGYASMLFMGCCWI